VVANLLIATFLELLAESAPRVNAGAFNKFTIEAELPTDSPIIYS